MNSVEWVRNGIMYWELWEGWEFGGVCERCGMCEWCGMGEKGEYWKL